MKNQEVGVRIQTFPVTIWTPPGCGEAIMGAIKVFWSRPDVVVGSSCSWQMDLHNGAVYCQYPHRERFPAWQWDAEAEFLVYFNGEGKIVTLWSDGSGYRDPHDNDPCDDDQDTITNKRERVNW